MSRKPLHRPRSGIGLFGTAGQSPDVVSLHCSPLHTSQQWELHGCPFWTIAYPAVPAIDAWVRVDTLFAFTLTPTFCTLAVVSIPPISARAVCCGWGEEWVQPAWREHADPHRGQRALGIGKRLNPISFVTWDRSIQYPRHTRYAQPGSLRLAGETPRPVDWSRFTRPEILGAPPVPDVQRLADDGCPHVEGE